MVITTFLAIIGIAVVIGGVMLYFSESQFDTPARIKIRFILSIAGVEIAFFIFLSVLLYRRIQIRKRGSLEFFEVIQ